MTTDKRNSDNGASGLRPTPAFTLIELLVVISIITLLIALLLPSIKRSKQDAYRVICQSNLKQWHLALYHYVGDHNDNMPITVNKIPLSWNMDWYANLGAYCQKELGFHVGPQGDSNPLGCPMARQDVSIGYQYHPNGNIWSYATNSSGFVWSKYNLITRPGLSPTLFDASGINVSNPYESWYGGTSALDYGALKFRHLKTCNLLMQDGHADNFRGNYIDESNTVDASKYNPGREDAPQHPDELLANGRPYHWHYFRDPTNPP